MMQSEIQQNRNEPRRMMRSGRKADFKAKASGNKTLNSGPLAVNH